MHPSPFVVRVASDDGLGSYRMDERANARMNNQLVRKPLHTRNLSTMMRLFIRHPTKTLLQLSLAVALDRLSAISSQFDMPPRFSR